MSSTAFSNFLRDLPDTLQQPAALAMLGSLGVHLILFATLPAFTSSPDPAQLEIRRVRLFEPPGGSSAPQASTSRLGLPPVPNTPNSKIQLPPAGTPSVVPNPLYTIPDLTPPTVQNPPQQQTQSPFRITRDNRLQELLRQIRERSSTPPSPPKPPVQPQPPQPPTGSPGGLQPADPSQVAVGSTPMPPGGTQPQTGQTPTPTPAPSPTFVPQTPNDKLLIATRFTPQGIIGNQQDYFAASNNFLKSIAEKGIDVTKIDYIRLRQIEDPTLEKPIQELPYPLPFALQNYKQHPVAVAVLIGKDGKPLPNTKPELIGSTGYQILNDKAIELVQQEVNQPDKFKPIDQDRVRVVVYEFKFKPPNSATANNSQPPK